MKTTVEISDALLLAAKGKAADEGRSLRSVIESGLRTELSRRPNASRRSRHRRKLFAVPSKLPPDLNVSDRRTIYDWLLKSR